MVSMIFILSFGCKEKVVAPNTLTDEEKAEGWVLLFDGQTSNGWRGSIRTISPPTGRLWTERCTARNQGRAKPEPPMVATSFMKKNSRISSSAWNGRFRKGKFGDLLPG